MSEQQEDKKAHLQKYIVLHSQAGENGPKASKQRKSKMKKVSAVRMVSLLVLGGWLSSIPFHYSHSFVCAVGEDWCHGHGRKEV